MRLEDYYVNVEDYYVNNESQDTGEHEVHTVSCYYLPEKKTYLGCFDNCNDAVEKAKTYYRNVDGCVYCCPKCHKQ